MPHGQEWFLEKRKAMGKWKESKGNEEVEHGGYPGSGGVCYGVAHEGMTAFLAQEMEAFKKRYKLIADTPVADLAKEINQTRELYKSWSKKARDAIQSEFDDLWKKREANTRKQYNETDELDKAILEAKKNHQKSLNSKIQELIKVEKEKHFAKKRNKKKRLTRFELLSEMDAAAQTVITHQSQSTHPELFPTEDPIYVMEKPPEMLNSKLNDQSYLFTLRPLKLYQVKENNLIELKITNNKTISDIVKIKSINHNKPLQQQKKILTTQNIKALWNEIQANPGHLKKIKPISQNSDLSLPILMPKKLEEKSPITKVQSFCGIYTLEELTEYFKILRTTIDAKKTRLTSPIAMVLTSCNHAITVGYDPKTESWTLIDANNLPYEEIEHQPEMDKIMAEKVLKSFFCKKNLVVSFTSNLYVSKQIEKDMKECLSICQNDIKWRSMHEITSLKSAQIDDLNTSLLFHAIALQDLDFVTALLNKGANPDVGGGESNPTLLTRAASLGHQGIVDALLSKKANPNLDDKMGRTPLGAASYFGHGNIVNTLLNIGANPDLVETKCGGAPILWAIREGHEDIVKALLNKGANSNLADNNGRTPLFEAAQQNEIEIVKLLLSKKNTDINKSGSVKIKTILKSANLKGRTAEVETLLKSKNQVPLPDKIPNFTPLFVAAFCGHTKIFKMLLDHNAAQFIRPLGISLLEMAVAMDHPDIVRLLLNKELEEKNKPDFSARSDAIKKMKYFIHNKENTIADIQKRYSEFKLLDHLAIKLSSISIDNENKKAREHLNDVITKAYRDFSKARSEKKCYQIIINFRKAALNISSDLQKSYQKKHSVYAFFGYNSPVHEKIEEVFNPSKKKK